MKKVNHKKVLNELVEFELALDSMSAEDRKYTIATSETLNQIIDQAIQSNPVKASSYQNLRNNLLFLSNYAELAKITAADLSQLEKNRLEYIKNHIPLAAKQDQNLRSGAVVPKGSLGFVINRLRSLAQPVLLATTAALFVGVIINTKMGFDKINVDLVADNGKRLSSTVKLNGPSGQITGMSEAGTISIWQKTVSFLKADYKREFVIQPGKENAALLKIRGSRSLLAKTAGFDSKKNGQDQVWQYLKTYENSSASLFMRKEGISIEVQSGSFYYFGKNGIPVTFVKGDLAVILTGTKVKFDSITQANGSSQLQVSLIEGQLKIQKRNQSAVMGKTLIMQPGMKLKLNLAESRSVGASSFEYVQFEQLGATERKQLENEFKVELQNYISHRSNVQEEFLVAKLNEEFIYPDKDELNTEILKLNQLAVSLQGAQLAAVSSKKEESIVAKNSTMMKAKTMTTVNPILQHHNELVSLLKNGADKSVTIFLKNGSKLSGVLKTVEPTVALIKTEYGDFSAKIADIDRIKSN